MFPVLYSIMTPVLIVPVRLNCNLGLVSRLRKNGRNRLKYARGHHTNLRYEFPRKLTMNKKLSLLRLLQSSPISGPDSVPINLIQIAQACPEFHVISSSIREREGPPLSIVV